MATTAPVAAALPERTSRHVRDFVAPGLLTVAALALLLLGLGSRSVWLDEALTVGVARTPLSSLNEAISVNGGNMALYNLFMRGWLAFGLSEWWIRLPSVLFAAATVPVLFSLANRLYGRRTAVVATIFLVASTPLIRFAQNARAYSLVLLLVTAAWLAALRFADDPSRRNRNLFIVLATLSIYSHLLAALFVAAQLTWLLALRPPAVPPIRALRLGTAIGSLAIPQLVMAFGPQAHEPVWVAPLNGGQLRRLLSLHTGWLSDALIPAFVALWVVGAVIIWRRSAPARVRHLLPVFWLVLPVVMAAALSVTVTPLMVSRYLLPGLPASLMLVAVVLGAGALRRTIAATLCLLSVGLPTLVSIYDDPNPDWRGASAFLLDRAHDEDAVVFANEARHLFELYWELHGKPAGLPVPLAPADPWEQTRRLYSDVDPSAVRSGAERFDVIWLVERQLPGWPRDAALFEAVTAGHELRSENTAFRGVWVGRYERRP